MPQIVAPPIELYLPYNYPGEIRTHNIKYQKFMTYPLVYRIFLASECASYAYFVSRNIIIIEKLQLYNIRLYLNSGSFTYFATSLILKVNLPLNSLLFICCVLPALYLFMKYIKKQYGHRNMQPHTHNFISYLKLSMLYNSSCNYTIFLYIMEIIH